MLLSAKTLKVDLTVDTDILSVTNYLFGGTICRDRFNILNNLSNIRYDLHTADTIPTYTKESFADIADKEAQKLITSADGKNIGILWSGGVDSTCVVSAFIRNSASKSQLKIIGTADAIRDSPYYAEFLKKEGYDVTITDDLPKAISNIENCAHLVSGAGGDQLCMHMIHRYDYSLYGRPWIDGVCKMFEILKTPLSDNSLEYFHEIWKYYGKVLDVNLQQYCEFVWLYNFGIRFDFVRDREQLMIIRSKNADKYVGFFTSFAFQQWAVSNWHTIKDYHQVLDRYHYKTPFKDYTYSVVKNRECYELGKHVSRPYPYEKITEIVVKDTEGIKIYTVANKYYLQAAQYVANMYRKKPALL